MRLAPVIGLEIHIQLKTKSKMFCPCPTGDAAIAPNTHVCPICMGHPGTLPVPNEQAIQWAMLMGLALRCQVSRASKFDRKHYFYPDLPKAYQISQYDVPINGSGQFEIDIPGGTRPHINIDIVRAHLEEDAAKLIHPVNHPERAQRVEGPSRENTKTYVDFNRSGTPLLETVTAPDFRTPQEAKVFLQELRLLARELGVSNADMEKGQLRCDANISLREVDAEGLPVSPTLHPKTEIKNMNSFKAVERALEYEIMRQTKLWEAGEPPAVSSTRGWNDAKQVTEPQRTKEEAGDYRYFPEPDVPPLVLKDLIEELRSQLPELPAAKRARFVSEYRLRLPDVRVICEEPLLADYTERVFSELHAWLQALPELNGAVEEIWEKERHRLAKLVGGWLVSKLGGLMKEHAISMTHLKIDPENFAEFITLVATGKLSTTNGMAVLSAMLETGQDPSQVMEDKRLGLLSDETEIAEVIERVLAGHPAEVSRYRAGEKQLLQFFIGMAMRESEGKADPGITKNMLLVKLEK